MTFLIFCNQNTQHIQYHIYTLKILSFGFKLLCTHFVKNFFLDLGELMDPTSEIAVTWKYSPGFKGGGLLLKERICSQKKQILYF